MIDFASGIEVFITPHGSKNPYEEYHETPSKPDDHPGARNVRYIEAVTNDCFTIWVRFPADFDFKGGNAVKIKYNVDNGTARTTNIVWNTQSWDGPYLDNCVSFKAFTNNECKCYGLVFGEAGLSDDADITQEQEEIELATRGRIDVTIVLGTAESNKERTKSGRQLHLMPPHTNKSIAINHGKSHSLMPQELGPSVFSTTYILLTKARGEAGMSAKFTHFYTSRIFLDIKQLVLAPQPAALLSTKIGVAGRATKSTSKRKETKISEDVDDEEQLPMRPIKPEERDITENTERPQTTIGSASPNARPAPGPSTPVASTSENMMPSGNERKKPNKRRRLMLELEKNKIERQLLELEDEDHGDE